jgi:hypothetical protein
MKHTQLALSIFFILGIASSTYAAEFLTPDEIKTNFATGVPFTAESAGGTKKMLTLNPDGTAKVVSKGKKAGQAGTWRVSSDGYCSTWGKGTENCYLIKRVGKTFEVLTAKKVLIARWSK